MSTKSHANSSLANSSDDDALDPFNRKPKSKGSRRRKRNPRYEEEKTIEVPVETPKKRKSRSRTASTHEVIEAEASRVTQSSSSTMMTTNLETSVAAKKRRKTSKIREDGVLSAGDAVERIVVVGTQDEPDVKEGKQDLRDEHTRINLMIRFAYCINEFYPGTNMSFVAKLVGLKDEEEPELEHRYACIVAHYS